MLVRGRERPVLILEAAAAVLLTLASVLVILAVVAADRWDEAAGQRDDGREPAPPWRKAA
jgi:hypothetical protein